MSSYLFNELMHGGYGDRSPQRRNADYDATTPWFDSSGKVILGADGLPLLLPLGFDTQAVLSAGAATSPYDLVGSYRNLSNFAQGGPWDLQRQSGFFNSNLIDSATVLIGAYGASSGIVKGSLLAVQSSYAIFRSSWAAGTVMSTDYPSLPARNVGNTGIGYDLVGGGRVKLGAVEMLRKSAMYLLPWLAANFVGIGVYLRNASQIWPRAEESGGPDLGNAFYWASHSVPILLLFLILNFVVVIVLRKSTEQKTASDCVVLFRLLAILWVLVVVFDYYRSS